MLVVGASGIVGRAALEHFNQLTHWRAIGVSRRAPDLPGIEHVALDLQDKEACERDLCSSVRETGIARRLGRA